MAQSKKIGPPETPPTKSHIVKVTLADLGKYWAQGYDLDDQELKDVTTHLDPQTRDVFIEYVTGPKPQPPRKTAVQKVTTRRKRTARKA